MTTEVTRAAIRERMRRASISQPVLAHRMGSPVSTVYRILECGADPKVTTAERLLSALAALETERAAS